MEEFGQDIVWGIVNSFHVTSQRIEKREDDATKKLGDMARAFDPSEIYASNWRNPAHRPDADGLPRGDGSHARLRRRDLPCRNRPPVLDREGTRVSSGLTASQIDARDFLAARAAKRREDHAPTGPVVIFSGGTGLARP
jgi:hypothetical protein